MGTRSKYQSYLLLAVALINMVFSLGLLIAASVLQSNLDARADGVTELMFPLLRAQVVAVQTLGFLLLFLTTVALLCVVEGTRGLYTALIGWSAAVVVMQVPPFIVYQLARNSAYLTLRAKWLEYLQATFVDVYSGASYTADQNSPPYLWNHLMALYSCCGVSASTSTQNAYDYQYARWWKGSSYVTSYWSNGTGVSVAEKVPLWCCKMSSAAEFPTPALADTSGTCLTSPSTSNAWVASDCGSALLGASGVNEYAWHVALSFLWALSALQPAWMLGIAAFALSCGTTRGLCVRLVRPKGQKKSREDESSGSEDDGDVSEEEQLLRDKAKEEERKQVAREHKPPFAVAPRGSNKSRPLAPPLQPQLARAAPVLEMPARTVEM